MRTLMWRLARAGWALGYGLLSLLWLVHGEWLWAGLAGALGITALGTSYGRWSWPASVNFLALLAVSGFGAALNNWAALGSVLCGLVAWDLEVFVRRLQPFLEVSDTLVWSHLRRLVLIGMFSVGAGAGALSWRVSLGFGWAVLLACGFLLAFLFLLRQAVK